MKGFIKILPVLIWCLFGTCALAIGAYDILSAAWSLF